MIHSKLETCHLRRRSDDPFFSEGYKLSLGGDSSVVILIHHVEETAQDSSISEKEEEESMKRITFPCCSPGCSEVFDTMLDCEEHYEAFHTKVCHICNAIFPTDHLLELHIAELHDSYFQTALESKRARLSCLVATCSETFENDTDRLKHLRKCHNYPRWFRFHPRSQLTFNNNMNNNTCLPKTNKKQQLPNQKNHKKNPYRKSSDDKHQNYNNDHIHNPDVNMDMNDEKCQLLLEKRAARKERQKKKRALIPCKFYTSDDGCRYGEKCMFLHSDAPISKNDTTCMDDNHNMDTLTHQMKQVSIPDKISFGRRKGR